MIYLIGALKNPNVLEVAKRVREAGHEVYDEWYCPGKNADLHWQEYCNFRGLTYAQALTGWHAKQVFDIDKFHLDRCDAAILVLPAGKSGHLELGYVIGLGKPGYILLDAEPEKFDIMYGFSTKVTTELDEIITAIQNPVRPPGFYPCDEYGNIIDDLENRVSPTHDERFAHSFLRLEG